MVDTAGQSHDDGALLGRYLFLSVVVGLDLDYTHPSLWTRDRFFHCFIRSVYNHLEERDCHGKKHPDVDHLDVGGDWQALRKPKKTKKVTISFTKKVSSTYIVANTNRMVRLTSTTIST